MQHFATGWVCRQRHRPHAHSAHGQLWAALLRPSAAPMVWLTGKPLPWHIHPKFCVKGAAILHRTSITCTHTHKPETYHWVARPAKRLSLLARGLQVALNQFALGPVVLAVSFAWNLVLTGQASKFASKLRKDGPPSMVNGALLQQTMQRLQLASMTWIWALCPRLSRFVFAGWKFWVPASGVNFWLVPLRLQVSATPPHHCPRAAQDVATCLHRADNLFCTATGAVHVNLRHALDWLPVVCLQQMMRIAPGPHAHLPLAQQCSDPIVSNIVEDLLLPIEAGIDSLS
jgi:Mpv17 / PMP22 family